MGKKDQLPFFGGVASFPSLAWPSLLCAIALPSAARDTCYARKRVKTSLKAELCQCALSKGRPSRMCQ